MAKVVERNQLTWYDHLYLPGIASGLAMTFREMFKPNITVQYPEERQTFYEDYRGAPVLVKDQENREKCVSCQLCEFICPPKAILIEPGGIPLDSDVSHVEKAPKEFFIDMLRCIYCGFCEEICPEEAIFMSDLYEINGSRREDLVFNKQKLYELGGTRPDSIQKWKGK